jgi:hypothetical protein
MNEAPSFGGDYLFPHGRSPEPPHRNLMTTPRPSRLNRREVSQPDAHESRHLDPSLHSDVPYP